MADDLYAIVVATIDQERASYVLWGATASLDQDALRNIAYSPSYLASPDSE